MKGLTVRQPWAEAIACGAKLVENRSMGTRYRGPLAIHAGKGWAEWGFADQRLLDLWPDGGPMPWQRTLGYALRHVPALRGKPPAPFVAGAVLAVAVLEDVHEAAGCCEPWGEDHYAASDGKRVGRVFHWVLDEPLRLSEPIECRGRLGLWEVPGDVKVRILMAQLEDSLAAAGAARPEGHR